MKPFKAICLLIALSLTSVSFGQFLDKLGKKAEKAVERTVERRVEKETQKSTDRALDSVIEAPKKEKKRKKKSKNKNKKKSKNIIGGDNETDSLKIAANSHKMVIWSTRKTKNSPVKIIKL